MSVPTQPVRSGTVSSVLEAIKQSNLLQIDSCRDVVFETPPPDELNTISQYFNAASRSTAFPPSDSDSGNSLFLTQSVTPVHRTTRRHQPSKGRGLSFNLGSESESDRASDEDNIPHEGERPNSLHRKDINHENKADKMFGAAPEPVPVERARRRRSRVPSRVGPKRMVTPFVQKTRTGKLTLDKNQILVHSQVGGLFKCIKKLKKGREERREELDLSLFPTVLTDDMTEVDYEDDLIDIIDIRHDHDDVRVVDADCFILNPHRRNRQPWFPKTRQKVRPSPKKPTKKSKTDQEKGKRQKNEKSKVINKKKQGSAETSKNAKALTRSQELDETLRTAARGLHGLKTSQNKRTKRSKANESNKAKKIVSTSTSPLKTSLLFKQEEHSEKQLEVLATCTQSESLSGFHDRTSEDQDARDDENLAAGGSDDGGGCSVIEETQRPGPTEESEETLTPDILVDESGKRYVANNAFCLDDISHGEHPERAENTCEHVQHETREEEVSGLHDQSDIGSQDLFLSQEYQTHASISFKNTEAQESKEDLESVVQHPKKRILLKNLNTEKEKDSDVVVDNGTHVAQVASDTADCPLFNLGGLNFLKRRKKKRTLRSELPHDSAQTDAGQNDLVASQSAEASEPETAQKKKKREKIFAKKGDDCVSAEPPEKPVDASLEDGVTANAFLSPDKLQNPETPTLEVCQAKTKKKKRKDKNIQDSEGICGEDAIHKPGSFSGGLGTVGDGTEQADLFSTSSNNKMSHNDRSIDVHESRHDENAVQLDDFEPPRKKKKKAKKKDLISVMDGNLVDEGSKSVHDTHGTEKAKKKNDGSFMEDADRERQNEEGTASKFQSDPAVSVENLSNCLVVQEGELVTRKKKKKKTRKEVVEEQVDEEVGEAETADHTETLEEVQDSGLEAAEVVRKKKKSKKKKSVPDAPDTVQEDDIQTPCPASERVSPSNGPGDLTRTDCPNPILETNVHQQISGTEIDEDVGYYPNGFGGLTPQKKKKKKKAVESNSSLANVEKEVEEVIERRDEGAAGYDFHCDQNPAVLPIDKLVTHKKKKKKKRKEVDEEQVDVEAGEEVEAIGHAETAEASLVSGLEAAEMLTEKKVKKKKKKKRRSSSCDREAVQEEDVQTVCPSSEYASVFNTPGDCDTPKARMAPEAHQQFNTGNDEEVAYCPPGLDGITPRKKKKKKKKVEGDILPLSPDAGGAECADTGSCLKHTDLNILEKELEMVSRPSEGNTSCSETRLESSPTRDKKKRKRTSSSFCSDSKSSQSTLQADDAEQLKKKKRKEKEKMSELDRSTEAEVHIEVSGPQESLSGSSSMPSGATSEKKRKKKRKT